MPSARNAAWYSAGENFPLPPPSRNAGMSAIIACSSASVTVMPAFSAAAYITRSSTSWSSTAAAHLRAVQQARIHLPLRCPAQLLLALAQCLAVLAPADLGTGHRGDLVAAAAAAEIEVDTEKREGNGQEPDDHSDHDAAILDEIEHG